MIREITQAFLDAILAVEALILDASEHFTPVRKCECGGALAVIDKTATCDKCNKQYQATEA